MKKTLVGLLAVFSLAVTMAVAQEAPPAKTAPLVSLSVSVSDKNGKPVVGLTKEEIEVTDNGKPVSVTEFRSEELDPMVFALVLDASNSMRDKIAFVRKSTLQLFDAMNTGDNRGIMVQFDTRVEASGDFLTRKKLQKELEDYQPGGGTALYDAIYGSSQQLARLAETLPAHPTRRILIVICDGADNQSRFKLKQAVEAALRSGVTIFPIGLLNQAFLGDAKRTLEELARDTGGKQVLLDAPRPFLDPLMDGVRSQYLLTFIPNEDSGKGGSHALKVTVVRGKEAQVVAPVAYFPEQK